MFTLLKASRRANFRPSCGAAHFGARQRASIATDALVKNEQVMQRIVQRCLNLDPLQKGLFSEADKAALRDLKESYFDSLRVYSRVHKINDAIEREFFITFKPYLELNYFDSPILNALRQTDTQQKMGYGLGFNQAGIRKVWIAPYGNQLEFMHTLATDYTPFLGLAESQVEKPHFIGYFPDSQSYQIYYYAKSFFEGVDQRLATLNSDYIGLSKTYNRDWQLVKENHYAIRVPFNQFLNEEGFDLPPVRHLNISYRKSILGVNETAVSYLTFNGVT